MSGADDNNNYHYIGNIYINSKSLKMTKLIYNNLIIENFDVVQKAWDELLVRINKIKAFI